jgi:hypothetical protein
MGININVSRNIVFGPKQLRWMAIRQLNTLQGTHHTQYLIGHITNNDGVGKRMWICIEAIQLKVGTFEPFFFLPYYLHSPTLISRYWINEIWSFSELFNCNITITNSWLYRPQYTDYESIMSLAVIFTSIKGELRQINICQIYLQVISTSDISNFDGTRITQQSYDGTFM